MPWPRVELSRFPLAMLRVLEMALSWRLKTMAWELHQRICRGSLRPSSPRGLRSAQESDYSWPSSLSRGTGDASVSRAITTRRGTARLSASSCHFIHPTSDPESSSLRILEGIRNVRWLARSDLGIFRTTDISRLSRALLPGNGMSRSPLKGLQLACCHERSRGPRREHPTITVEWAVHGVGVLQSSFYIGEPQVKTFDIIHQS